MEHALLVRLLAFLESLLEVNPVFMAQTRQLALGLQALLLLDTESEEIVLELMEYMVPPLQALLLEFMDKGLS